MNKQATTKIKEIRSRLYCVYEYMHSDKTIPIKPFEGVSERSAQSLITDAIKELESIMRDYNMPVLQFPRPEQQLPGQPNQITTN